MDPPNAPVVAIPPTISWVVDVAGTLAVDSRTGKAHWLRATDAAVWSWLSAGVSGPGLASLLAGYLAVERAEAARALVDILRSLEDAGLAATGASGRG